MITLICNIFFSNSSIKKKFVCYCELFSHQSHPIILQKIPTSANKTMRGFKHLFN